MSPTKPTRVLVVGDSMALPRPEVAYDKTWPYLLGSFAGASVEVINRSRRGASTDLLLTEGGDPARSDYPRGADCLESYAPAVAVLQLGIVDCAPRLIARGSLESRIVDRLPPRIRRTYLSILKKHRRRSVERAYVPPARFRDNLATYVERAMNIGAKVVFVEIAPLGAKYLASNPEGGSCREQYNAVLREQAGRHPEHCRTVAPFGSSEVEACVLDDGYHTNAEGHRRIAQQIATILKALQP